MLAAITLLWSCDNTNHSTLYTIQVKQNSISCSYDPQTIEIEYTLMGEPTMVSATTSADWVQSIDTSTDGKIVLDVAANDDAERSTTLTISAAGHVNAKIKLTQIAPPKDTAHTLMFYFFGTSLSRYFKTNINDAKTAIKSGALGNNNRVIYILQTGSSTARIREICYSKSSNECIERELETVRLDAKLISPDDIAANIAKMAEYAPADRYGIVMAGHGQGWIPREVLNGNGAIMSLSTGFGVWQPAPGAEVTRALGEDNVQVNPTELAEAIDKSGIDLDYILFDACFMSNIEAVYDLREAANYIIASPCEIMGNGFPYHRTLPHLFTDNGNTSDFMRAAESYYIFYRDEYTYMSCGSVAVYDCAEIEALAETTKRVVATATSDYDKSELQTYEGKSVHQFYDFGEWVNVVATDQAALAAFNAQLENTVIAKYSLPSFYSAYGSYGTYPIDLDVYSGVTTSAPSEAFPNDWRKTNWYNYVWGE